MQNDKNLELVKSIEKFPCLYNTSLIDYIRRDATDDAWNYVAKQTQLTVSECKEKWKNLRYGLLRSLRPNVDGSVKKKYYLHDEMEFVIPFLKSSNRHDIPIQSADDTGIDYDVANYQDTEQSPAYTHYEEVDILQPPKKKLRPNEPKQKKYQLNYANTCDDSRKMFLLSLLPEVNALTEHQMRLFRRKIFSLIDEVSEIESPTTAPYDICFLEANDWQKDSTGQGSESSQNLIKKEPL